jgi:hypothetical protein
MYVVAGQHFVDLCVAVDVVIWLGLVFFHLVDQ